MNCTTTQNKNKKLARFSRLLWHPACKWRGPIFILMLHKIPYLLGHLSTYLHAGPKHDVSPGSVATQYKLTQKILRVCWHLVMLRATVVPIWLTV